MYRGKRQLENDLIYVDEKVTKCLTKSATGFAIFKFTLALLNLELQERLTILKDIQRYEIPFRLTLYGIFN